ncbi:hypothetical protein [Halegenticoccus soli]|uniref:hypothetical protein n=1 Tax=Halegenticoccus soli TaxID=1985678 RepID=UPI000C6EDD18|nr:hypothetical protein [Halegenticoccus soli]
MAKQVVTQTYTAGICNQRQVRDDLDSLGFAALRDRFEPSPRIDSLYIEQWRRGFRHDHEDVLTIEVTNVDAALPVAHQIRELGRPGEYKCFNVDFSREFRYCLENDLDPTPTQTPSTLSLKVEPVELANPPITELTIDCLVIGALRNSP